jgi:hypothetical protein
MDMIINALHKKTGQGTPAQFFYLIITAAVATVAAITAIAIVTGSAGGVMQRGCVTRAARCMPVIHS